MKKIFYNIYLILYPWLLCIFFRKYQDIIEMYKIAKIDDTYIVILVICYMICFLLLIKILFVAEKSSYHIAPLMIGAVEVVLMLLAAFCPPVYFIVFRIIKTFPQSYLPQVIPICGMYLYSVILFLKSKREG